MSGKIQKAESRKQKSEVQVVPFHSAMAPTAPPNDPQYPFGRILPLEFLKQQLTVEYAAAVELRRLDVFHSVKAGLLMLQIKAQLAWGAWLPWIKANAQFSARECQRCMQMGEGFIRDGKLEHREVLLLTDGADKNPKQRKAAEQLLLDFVGDRTQEQILALYSKRGGQGKAAMQQTPQHMQIWHQRRFAGSVKELDALTGGKLGETDMRWLEPNELIDLANQLEEFGARLRGELKRRQQKPAKI